MRATARLAGIERAGTSRSLAITSTSADRKALRDGHLSQNFPARSARGAHAATTKNRVCGAPIEVRDIQCSSHQIGNSKSAPRIVADGSYKTSKAKILPSNLSVLFHEKSAQSHGPNPEEWSSDAPHATSVIGIIYATRALKTSSLRPVSVLANTLKCFL